MKNYTIEIEGQIDFYKDFRIDAEIANSNDGIFKGVLFENKLSINRPGSVLFQLIKYCSKLRLLGKKLPYYLIANSLNEEKCYIFKTKDYINDIEKVYQGSASQNNNNYIYNSNDIEIIDYSNFDGADKLKELIKESDKQENILYHIDFNNILGLAKEYYKLNTKSTAKNDFLDLTNGELRKPDLLKDRIIPYDKEDNLEFSTIMDCLNPNILQKELGAFYTPKEYVKLSQNMLINYIEKVIKPKNKDYIIIDRCAGTGQLEEGLPDDILAQCILSTIEPNEYLVLQEKFGDKAMVVIPTTDALSYDIIPTKQENGNIVEDKIRDKINDNNTVIILYENPPYSENGSRNLLQIENKSLWKESFVCNEMKKEHKGVITNDLANLFIWSAFKYYLRNEDDSYIVYSPAKYFKTQNLINKKLRNGFICNREHFNATAGAISCIQWINKDKSFNKVTLAAYDIDNDKLKKESKCLHIQKCYNLLSNLYDKRVFNTDTEDGILCETNGLEFKYNGRQISLKPIDNKNIIGYISTQSFSIGPAVKSLLRCGKYDGHGFYLRNDNYLEKLPLFVAAQYPKTNWWDDIYNKTSDKNDIFINDNDFIRKCFIYTCLTANNKCRSLYGSNNKLYYNELTFNNMDIANDTESYITLADQQLKIYKDNNQLTEKEKELIKDYYKILSYIESTDEYNDSYTYGLFQIKEEINIQLITGQNTRGKDIKTYKYPVLNDMIKLFNNKVKAYYEDNIISDLFKYELIK